MRLIPKIIILFILLVFVFFITQTYAIDLLLDSMAVDTESSSIENDEINSSSGNYETEEKEYSSNQELYSDEQVETTGAQVTYTSSPAITSTVKSENNELSISDIINIILIAVSVVLIFLAVAILIRCK